MKTTYSELVSALNDLRQCVDGHVLNACSPEEIRDSYSDLQRASVRAEILVKRAKHPNAKVSAPGSVTAGTETHK